MITSAKTIIFDCDGVILNSNKVKSEAYFKVVSAHYGSKLATLLVEYLSMNTGNPREYFFNYFLKNIVPQNISGPGVEQLLSEVSKEICKGLMECEISESLFNLRNKLPNTKWLVVSGGVERELKSVFDKRAIFDLFDGGIYGGPMSKDEILSSLIQQGSINYPAVYLGDSSYDYEVSSRYNLDFLFISDWSDFKDWKNYCNTNKLSFINSLYDLL